jgi:Family of unknown function (DUF5335)
MSTTKQLTRENAEAYFDRLSKRFLLNASPEAADIEVLAMEWGDQYVSEGARLAGITFNAQTNTLEFELDGGDHRVYQPREIWVVEEPDGFVSAVEVMRPDGVKEVVKLQHVGLQKKYK